jgi:hypothetical protein
MHPHRRRTRALLLGGRGRNVKKRETPVLEASRCADVSVSLRRNRLGVLPSPQRLRSMGKLPKTVNVGVSGQFALDRRYALNSEPI